MRRVVQGAAQHWRLPERARRAFRPRTASVRADEGRLSRIPYSPILLSRAMVGPHTLGNAGADLLVHRLASCLRKCLGSSHFCGPRNENSVTGLTGFFIIIARRVESVFRDTSNCLATARSERAGLREAALRLQQRWCWWPKHWTRGTIESRNAVRGVRLDIFHRREIAAPVKREAFVPALTAPRVLVSEERRRAICQADVLCDSAE